MQAFQLFAKETFKFVDIPKPDIASDEVLLKIAKVGICGTDLHLYHSDPKVPLIMGHEFVGTVDAVGHDVKNVAVGELATAEHVKWCGKCIYCQMGKRNLCLNHEIYGLTRPGALAEYLAVPAELVYPLHNLDADAGVLVEPLSIAVYGVRRADVGIGNTVAVVGQGPIGLFVDQATKAAGARVYGFDIMPARLTYVQKNKLADAAYDSSQPDTLKKFQKSSGCDGADVVFEVVGRQETLDLALALVRPGGKLVVLGLFDQPIHLDMTHIVRNEITVLGSYTCMNSFLPTIQLLEHGAIHTKDFITHRYPFAQAEKAFQDASNYTENRIKTVIEF